MFKSLQRMMLLALVALFGGAMANAQTTITWDASSGDALPNVSVGNDLNLTWVEGSGDQAPMYSTQSNKKVVSMKSGNKLIVAGASDAVTISQIVFTYVGDNLGLTANVGSTKNNYTDNTSTWTGEANSITFSAGGRRYVKSIEVTYTGSAAPVDKVPVLAITSDGIADTYDMDDNGVFVVYYENTGNAAAENAKLTLYVDGQENNSKTIGRLDFGSSNQNFWNAKYNLEGIEAGEHQVYLSLTADNADAVQTVAKTVTFTKKALEATFTVTAEDVDVEFGAASYQVVATVTNTSETVAAEGVTVQLQRNAQNVAEPQTIDLAAGETKQVTFTVTAPDGGFASGETNLWVMVRAYEKTVAQQEVTVTVAEQVVPDVKDLALVGIDGTIDLANETSNVRIIVQNNGNVDITDAAVTLKAGETVLGTAVVSAVKGQTGFCYVAVASEGLTAGELTVTATVEVEEDATPADNTMEATLTVKDVPAPVADFSVTAENVTVSFDDESFDIKAIVKNISEVTANGLTVKLLKGVTVVETKTLNVVLAPGEETEVTFQVANEIAKGQSATYYVQAGSSQAEVVVTCEDDPIVPIVDINLIDIRGLENINLKAEQNTVMVTFQNNSNVDVENATITLTMNGVQVGEPQVIAKGEYYKSFTLPTEGLVAGETATLVATLSAENNVEGNTVEVTKTLAIVSGEVEPAAEIAINPISNWEVQAGEQEVAISVVVYNNGDADAKDVKIQLYKNYSEILAEQTIDIPAAGGDNPNYKMITMKFNYTFEQGKDYEFTVFTNYKDADVSDNEQKFTLSCPAVVADVAVLKIADIKATVEDQVKINAVLKNNSDIDATEVKVGVYTQDENFQYQLVGIQRTVETIAAGETAEVEFNLGQLEAGTYRYYVRVVTTDGNLENNMQDVNVTVTEVIVPAINVALTAIQGISNIDLAEGASNVVSVWVANEGNVDAEAVVAVKLNETELEAQTIEVKAGGNAYATFTLPTAGLVAGEKATLVATVTAEGNSEEAVTTMTREYDIVDSSVATEPVFEVAAENVTVPFGATSFEIKANVKNTSSIDATGVEVKLFRSGVVATQTIEALAAGAEQEVTFTIEATEDNPFTAGKTVIYFVQAPKAQAEVSVTFQREVTPDVVEVALSQVSVAGGQIDLAAETNVATVWVENKGNVDAEATIGLSLNGTALEAQTISVNAGTFGRATFTLPVEGLVAGEKATLIATVTVENNTSEAVSETKEYDVVNSAVVTEPVFEIAAENVTVPFGATSFEIKTNVKNTSNIDAQNVEVKLFRNTVVATQTIEALAAGAEQEVTFTIEATEENPFTAGRTVIYYVQAPKVQAEVNVTFANQEDEKVIDLAVTSISGGLSVEVETNYLTVFVENKGNVDVKDAVVKLNIGEVELGTANVSANAGSTGFCSIAVSTTALVDETFDVTATVEVADDADLTNNTLTRTFQITMPEAQVEITVEDVIIADGATSFVVPVKVKNLRENFAAKNVKVMIYDGYKLIGQTTIETIAAGAEVTVDVEINVETSYTNDTTLKAWATGYSEYQLVDFQLIVNGTAINSVQQMAKGQKVYTIDGQKVNSINKAGIYVINGRKVVVK